MKIEITEKEYIYDDASFETMLGIQDQGKMIIAKYLEDYVHHMLEEHESIKPTAYALIEMAYRLIRLSEKDRTKEDTEQLFDVLSYFASHRVEMLIDEAKKTGQSHTGA
jgi:hypothetical protein